MAFCNKFYVNPLYISQAYRELNKIYLKYQEAPTFKSGSYHLLFDIKRIRKNIPPPTKILFPLTPQPASKTINPNTAKSLTKNIFYLNKCLMYTCSVSFRIIDIISLI